MRDYAPIHAVAGTTVGYRDAAARRLVSSTNKGVDLRTIDAWVGHLSPEMVRRYRHMLPDQQKSAIDLAFGEPSSAKDPVEPSSAA